MKAVGREIYIFSAYLGVALTVIFRLVSTECLMPDGSFPNGRIIYENLEDFNLSSVPEHYVLKFRCRRSYERIGPQVVVCLTDGWNSEFPKCLFLECPPPPPLSNAHSEFGRRIIGSTARYKCNQGYEFLNSNYTSLTCSLNGTNVEWLGELSHCKEKSSCSDPGVSKNGFRSGSCCFVGDIAKYSCDIGYDLIGPQSVECLMGGVWSAERPLCQPLNARCPDPPTIPNGVVKGLRAGDYYVPYDEVEVVCDPGYAYYGESEFIMCDETFEWEEEFGECKETFCICPKRPLNGTILEMQSTNSTEFPYKFEITYVCDEGFRLIGDIYRKCDKGKWNGPDPRCEVIKCPSPGRPENGNRIGDDFNVGEKVQFTCFQAFDLIGSVERYCMPNGQWSGELARCNLQSNYCPDPGVPINGNRIGSDYSEGDQVLFNCYPGFSLVGSAIRNCLPNRQWSGQEAKCLGAYDFDNPSEVSQTLKVAMSENAMEQEMKLVEFNNKLAAARGFDASGKPKVFQTQRILDLNYPGRLILYFVFDVSGSVRLKNFQTSIQFAKALVKKVGVSENGARVGALTFSSKAEIEFNPVQYSTTEDVFNALDRINYTSGGTASSSALRLVREESMPLTRAHMGAKGVKSVIFMLTDGKTNTGGNPEEQAAKLHEADVEIYCIGITGDILKNALYKIASQPIDEHVFVLNNYKTLAWLVQEITNGTIDYSECGVGLDKVGKSGHRSRIVGGTKVVEPWPWMAALYITDTGPSESQLKCGGSIIGSKWILTAAHCICKNGETVHRNIFQVTIKLGLTDTANFTHLQEYEVAKFYTHENYNPSNYDNDIGLIELNGHIEYNPYVRPICLPLEDLPANSVLYKPNKNAYAAGWGHSEILRKGETVNVRALKNLKELLLPIQSKKRCLQSLLDSGGSQEMFTENMICAGTGDGNSDTCLGDSGGPLMQSQLNHDGNIFWTQVGLVSWGIGCGQINTYGFYTNVQKELSWLQNVLKSENDE